MYPGMELIDTADIAVTAVSYHVAIWRRSKEGQGREWSISEQVKPN